ncbi:hypothetical protein BN1708_007308 [Verticillium longisporum]|uniref:eIF-2-alpha kinase activator GCN1 n=1 Tax=Verticillium longisporum TaxID=100787 RepID=A0A0G4MS56_VERLO|nr:hypothetical protein BN1708_007308 [Verticillium longisporum]
MNEVEAEPVANGADSGSANVDFAALKGALTSSSTRVRVDQLRALQERITQKKFDLPLVPKLLQLLFWTHAFYVDRQSRLGAQKCLSALLASGLEPELLAKLASILRAESVKPGIAITSAFVLVEWCSIFMQELSGTPSWPQVAPQILLANADSLEKCQQPAGRGTVARAAIVVTRRGLRKLLAPTADLEKTVKEAVELLTAKAAQPTAKNAVLLGVIAGVASRKPDAGAVLETLKASYFAFYTREVVGSRVAVPDHVAAGLRDFFSDFVTLDELTKDVIPTVEKGLLRAPEIVLEVLAPLVRSLPPSHDLSQILSERLLKPILANIKSSNPAIRSSTVAAFDLIASRSHDGKALEKACDEVVTPLKGGKLASADHRILHCEMLLALPQSDAVAEKIATALATVTAKEGNEAAVAAETAALARSTSHLLQSDLDVPKPVLDAFIKGAADKKPALRRIWILRAGEVIGDVTKVQSTSSSTLKFAEGILPKLVDAHNEVVANPQLAAQNNATIGAYVVVALLCSASGSKLFGAVKLPTARASILKQAVTLDPKPSFLLNPRVYGKIATEDELTWMSRALASAASGLTVATPSDVKTAWSEAFLYLICASAVTPKIRQLALDSLSSLYAAQPALISTAIVGAIWHWLEALDAGEKDTAAVLARTERNSLHLVVRAICLSPKDWQEREIVPEEQHLERQLCALFVLARPELLPRSNWIDLCLRVEKDPGDLARRYEADLLDEIRNKSGAEQSSALVKKAACNAAAELAFVAPETMTPRIVELIEQDLEVEELKKIGPLEAAIYRTPEGTAFVDVSVRSTVLQSISAEVDMSEAAFSTEIWLACHDDVEENAELGREIWTEGFEVSEKLAFEMLPYLSSKDGQLRRAAARSLAEASSVHPQVIEPLIEKLEETYAELAKPRQQELDQYGMPKKLDLADPWEGRHGIGSAFKELSPHMKKQQLDPFFDFLIQKGPLGDQNAAVRSEMLEAAIGAIDYHGKSMIDRLMAAFEKTLEGPDKSTEAADRVSEAVIIMYGALAKHLKKGDAKLPIVVERLLATLSTPSETVQYAIAECLPPLVQACRDQTPKYFQQVLGVLLTSKKYSEQRGAAYGLAGLVQGCGISTLKDHRIMTTLKGAIENKKEASQREAGLMALELLSSLLGRIFEPYVIQIVPELLTGFGDSNADVRDACLAAAKACFAKLSSYGVKQILPTLLRGLDDQQWRSKKGACDLLGAMAYLDPQQLALSLPDIIPPLTAVLNDSHKEVRSGANKSLKRFGEVISNPEVKGLVDILLKALSDPTKYTDDALDALIKVQFVHYLDAPSLALVTRILQRGLGERSNTKRKAAQVIGSLAHLTERKDLISHLPILVAGLKLAIVDPVPTTRATASRALGSLMEKLGEEALPDLIPGLMQTLKADTGAGDRLGSAQALSEVLAGLGTTRLEETLPTILQNVESSKAAVREGFMSLFIFLPVCFGNSFASYLGRIIPPILAGLADDVESIRETALRAGRLLVKNFAMRAVDLLLPELERGLADDSYRIRLSSVELVGDLLFNLTGITGNAEPGEEEEEMAREAGASLREVLGEEKRNKILSALYVCRCDTANAVRSAAIGVWKALVSSPRTLKELVPTLTQLIIRRLGSSNMEHKVIASNALGELIRKAGDGVLSTLLPTLEEGLQTSTDSDSKQGICLALKELISSASEEALEDHEKTLISVVRTALTDSDPEVREAAAEAFDSLQQILGKKAVDQVLPYLLNLLRSENEADNALSALLTLLTETARSNIILPNLIPTLITPHITAFDAKALASLSRVAGAAMNRRLPNIINSLMDNIVNCKEDDLRADLETSFDTVILSIDEYDGLNTVMNVLLQLTKHEDHRRRQATANHLAKFFAAGEVDYSRYNQDIIRSLLVSFDDGDIDVVKASWAALNEFTRKLKKEEMEALVFSTRQALQHVGVPGASLKGFELPKGINAVLPIFLQGLMNGTAEQRTQAALAISDIVDRASETALKPFVTQITGPLIRVVSERSTEVKAAILLTLNNLLEKMPIALKPFLPQLQRTFAKSLADTTSELLRARAAKALGTLIKYTPRIDPLIAELVTGSKTSDAGVKTAMLSALYEVISKAGANMGESSRAAVLGLIDTEGDEKDSAMTITSAKLLGALIKNVPEDAAHGLLRNRVITNQISKSSVLALNAVLVESPESLLGGPLADDLPEVLCHGMTNKTPFIADNFILATGKYLLSESPKTFEANKKIFETLAGIIQPGQPTDSRRLALVVAREAAFVSLFNVADEESKVFDKYVDNAGLAPNAKRSMQDYFKRVALRLGAQVRERREAEGGQGGLGLSNDEVEDEKEIWSVGKVDVGEDIFGK